MNQLNKKSGRILIISFFKTFKKMTSSDNPIFKLIDYIESNEYKGYDPYDGLNSKLLEYLPLPWKYARIAWIQFFKICPINFRKYFLISVELTLRDLD